MANGIALIIGLNCVDHRSYNGWRGQLSGCINDANAIESIAKFKGFETTKLIDSQAKGINVIRQIELAINNLHDGDFFFLYYSGHGGQIPDTNNDEPDKLDETWCLYDGQLLDDTLYSYLAKFKKGVRLFIMSDSCHSGTMLKSITPTPSKAKAMPRVVQSDIHNFKQDKATPNALLISGCQDNQYSADGVVNGAFTASLLMTWDNGNFNGNYRDLWLKTARRMPPTQSPNYFKLGSISFENERVLEVF